jgi:hypothetical protein
MFVPRYSEEEARQAVATSLCYSEALRKLGLRPAGSNHRQFRRYVDEVWRISTSHVDAMRARLAGLRSIRPVALESVLVEGSSYSRRTLKGRLYAEGLKGRRCELCGPQTRKVERPSYEQLMADVESMTFVAIGRKYGVSDNAVRKWIRWYEYRASHEQATHDEEGRQEDQAA